MDKQVEPENERPATVPLAGSARAWLSELPHGLALIAVFTLTTFLSALLLFSIQPLFAKMVLPLLGGAPSVWAVALCFFQGAQKFKTRYATLAFSDKANLDDGALWPSAFALKELTAAGEARIAALVKKAGS